MEKRFSIIYWYYFYSNFFMNEDLSNICQNKLSKTYNPSNEVKKNAKLLYEFCREQIEWSKNA